MGEKVTLIILFILLLFSCNKKNNLNKAIYYESIKKNAYIQLKGENITVFCNPMDIGKYGCSMIFGGKIKEGVFSKGYFLEKSKNGKNVFDTIYSNYNRYIDLKLENNNLLVNIKSDYIGCNILFHDEENGYSNESDTLELGLVKTKILGIALPKGFINIEEGTKLIETDDRPMLILEENKHGLKVIYKVDYYDNRYSKIGKKTGWISKKDCEILK